MLRYLLDTNIVIYVLKRRPIEVLSIFNANAGRMAISSITAAELLHGAEKSNRVSENLSTVEDFAAAWMSCPMASKRRSTTGRSVPPWNGWVSPLG
ncbi:type II toxin-antitoxin system VapC family toxin [Achromobacter xylosoxidans]